jgi:hypothetical protein
MHEAWPGELPDELSEGAQNVGVARGFASTWVDMPVGATAAGRRQL